MAQKNGREKLLKDATLVVQSGPKLIKTILEYTQGPTSQGKVGLDFILCRINSSEKITLKVNFPRYFQLTSLKDTKFVCHRDFSYMFAFCTGQHQNLMRPQTEDVKAALTGMIQNKIPLTFGNVLVQSLKNCLSKHSLVIDVTKFKQEKEVKSYNLVYSAAIDIENIKKSFDQKLFADGSQLGADELKDKLKLFMDRRNNPRDILASWDQKSKDIIVAFEKKARDEQSYGFSNFFLDYTRSALLMEYIIQLMGRDKPDNQKLEVFSLPRQTDKHKINMKGEEKERAMQAQKELKANNVYAKIIWGNKFVANDQCLIQIAMKPIPQLVFSRQNAVYNGRIFSFQETFQEMQNDKIECTRAWREDFCGYKTSLQEFAKCSNDFAETVYLKYLVGLERSKEKDKNKKANKSQEGFEIWLDNELANPT